MHNHFAHQRYIYFKSDNEWSRSAWTDLKCLLLATLVYEFVVFFYAKSALIGFSLFTLKGTRKEKKERKKKFIRMAAGQTWEDPTLAEWDTGKWWKCRLITTSIGNS